MLTDSLRKTLEFIQGYIHEHGYAPKFPEIAKGLGIKSTGVIHRYVHALQEAGLLVIESRRHRGIRLLAADAETDQRSTTRVPLWGKIAAGKPIEAIADQESLELASIFHGKNIYALKVQGDSMMEAGILDGDYVICEQCHTAENGNIVVALIDEQEATLKEWNNRRDGTVALIPANANYKTMIYEAKRIMIQGVVVGQIRQYG
ncbi:MAG: transcriptional repressor LexA [Legionellales bacterium]|nr:transcriptional repressor LexA [Legionellales bacterium]